jgi:biopolymer transport protein ExbD
MKVFLEPDDLDVRIEIVPLIDVIFCILVFFILGAVNFTRLAGLNVDLPQAETAQTQFSDTLPVEIDALGQIKFENTPITEDQLSQLLAKYVSEKPQGVVLLQADKLVSYGQVTRLIDKLQKVGGSRVALGAMKQTSDSGNSQSNGSTPNVPLQTLPNLNQPTVPTLEPNTPSGSTLPQQPGNGLPSTLPTAPNPTAPSEAP